eukprot:6729261-Prymnesium_polylepis.1
MDMQHARNHNAARHERMGAPTDDRTTQHHTEHKSTMHGTISMQTPAARAGIAQLIGAIWCPVRAWSFRATKHAASDVACYTPNANTACTEDRTANVWNVQAAPPEPMFAWQCAELDSTSGNLSAAAAPHC